MSKKRDEANLMGQIAGMIAVMTAVVQALPPTTRRRLPAQLGVQFDALLTAMRTTAPDDVESGIEGAEWVRDLFLNQIEKSLPGKVAKTQKPAPPASGEVDIQF